MNLEDYKEGEIYKCKLSDMDVLVIIDADGHTKGYMYNKDTESHEIIPIFEGQLIKKYNLGNKSGY